MSLKINNLATDKQIATLVKLEYVGTGQYAADKLNKQQAAELIDELFEAERLARKAEEEQMMEDDYTTEAQYRWENEENIWKD